MTCFDDDMSLSISYWPSWNNHGIMERCFKSYGNIQLLGVLLLTENPWWKNWDTNLDGSFSLTHCMLNLLLTHCPLVTPYGNNDICQQWLKCWLVAWWHQTITWINVDWRLLASTPVPFRSICLQMLQVEINILKLLMHLPRTIS